MPCTEKRARLLLERGRARVHRVKPFVIRLVDRTVADSALQPVRLKMDPGSKVIGIAMVLDQQQPKVLSLIEVHHKQGIKKSLDERRQFRRFRRNRYRRYRARRFNNRPRVKCHVCGQNARLGHATCRAHAGVPHNPEALQKRWLPPSIRARVEAQESWVRRLRRWCPVTFISVESVKFDTQLMQNPNISGVEYQQGTLQGYEVREYIFERDGHKCWWCGATDTVLDLDHVVPKNKGGTDRVSNLVASCRKCNEAHGNKLVEKWADELQKKSDTLSQQRLTAIKKWLSGDRPKPLKDAAAVNSARWELRDRLRASGLPVESGSGGQTKWNRTRLGLSKTHTFDALCVGVSASSWCDAGVEPLRTNQRVLVAKAVGRRGRKLTIYDRYGFVRQRRERRKRFHGISFGDIVCLEKQLGLVNRAPTPSRHERGTVKFLSGGEEKSFGKKMPLIVVQRADGYMYEVDSQVNFSYTKLSKP